MIATTFHEPVHLINDGAEIRVDSASQAYELLTAQWPEARGKWYHAATRACRSASCGDTSPHIARRMLIYAAGEARVAVR